MHDVYTERCKSLVFYLPNESTAAIYAFLEHIGDAFDDFFVYFLLTSGPILLVLNIFVMSILTRKELRSPYNTVFVIMALDQTLSVMNMSIWLARVLITRSDCNYSSYTLFMKRIDIFLVVLDDIFSVHLSFLAVFITAIRVRTLRNNGPEPSIRFILSICGLSFILIAFCFVPQFLSYEIRWLEKSTTCKNEVSRKVLVPSIHEIDLLFAQDCLLLRLQFFIGGMLFNVLPCVSLIVVTSLLLLRISKIRKGRSKLISSASSSSDSTRVSMMLIAIIISTLITSIPQSVLSILVSLLSDRFRSSIADRLDSFIVMLVIISTVWNFCVHLLMSRRFREVAKNSLCCFCVAFMKKKHVIGSS